MADSPYPVPREYRKTTILLGDGGTVYGPFAFKIFDIEDVTVWLQRDGAADFSTEAVTVVKTALDYFDTFTIEFDEALTAADKYYVEGDYFPQRSAGISKGTKLDPDALEKELSKTAVALLEIKDRLKSSVRIPVDGAAGYFLSSSIQDGNLLQKSGNYLVGYDIAGFEADIAAAAANAANAAVSEANALAYRGQAQGSAETAAAAAAEAADLVLDATAGFAGFTDGLGYDFGSITSAVTYFNQDWGSL